MFGFSTYGKGIKEHFILTWGSSYLKRHPPGSWCLSWPWRRFVAAVSNMDAAPFHEGCCWSSGTVLGTWEWCSLLQGCLNPQGCCWRKEKKQKRIHWTMEQYIYIQYVALSLTFNISKNIRQSRNRSTMASIDLDLCSLYVDRWEVEQEKESVDSWTMVREKTSTWDANMYLCMYLFASTHI